MIECLIAVSMAAVLGLILLPYLDTGRSRSRISRTHADLLRLRSAAEAYAIDWGGQYPPNHGLSFNFKNMLVPLSTPVAYILDSHLPDASGNRAYPELGGVYIYYYFNFDPNEDLIQVIYGTILFYPPSALAALTSLKYVFESTGPDRLIEFDRVQPPFGSSSSLDALNHEGSGIVTLANVYDPTNGALSAGDILISHGGFLGQN